VKRLLALLALLALWACTQKQVQDSANSLASSAPAVLGNAGIQAQVEARFLSIDADSALHVAVSAEGGTVKLSGKAKSSAVAEKFVAAAKAVDGVKDVSSTITIDPKLPPATEQAKDALTVATVKGSIVAQAGVNVLGVKVDAHGGAVRLSGSVKTEALKSTVIEAAKHATGVKSVDAAGLTVAP
jgi:osmotically-inducible protein OsmY